MIGHWYRCTSGVQRGGQGTLPTAVCASLPSDLRPALLGVRHLTPNRSSRVEIDRATTNQGDRSPRSRFTSAKQEQRPGLHHLLGLEPPRVSKSTAALPSRLNNTPRRSQSQHLASAETSHCEPTGLGAAGYVAEPGLGLPTHPAGMTRDGQQDSPRGTDSGLVSRASDESGTTTRASLLGALEAQSQLEGCPRPSSAPLHTRSNPTRRGTKEKQQVPGRHYRSTAAYRGQSLPGVTGSDYRTCCCDGHIR